MASHSTRSACSPTAGGQASNNKPEGGRRYSAHGDKGYDTDAIRRQVEATGAMPNIPPKANRRWKNCFSPALYRGRNAIERMFCRLKDFRRIARRVSPVNLFAPGSP